jgi:hypothetical protein
MPCLGDYSLAIPIEFVNVIVRKSAAEKKYSGGLDGLARSDLANYLEDEHLVRVGFMSTREAFCFAEQLEAAGLRFSEDGESDIAVITWGDPETPPWLSVGECEGRGACWLRDCAPGKLVDVDPYMMLRWAAPILPSVEDVVRTLRRRGADVRERAVNAEDPGTVLLDCSREGAQIEVEVFKDCDSGRIGVWGRRNLARRTSIDADQALMRDLTAALVSAGAEDPSGRR